MYASSWANVGGVQSGAAEGSRRGPATAARLSGGARAAEDGLVASLDAPPTDQPRLTPLWSLQLVHAGQCDFAADLGQVADKVHGEYEGVPLAATRGLYAESDREASLACPNRPDDHAVFRPVDVLAAGELGKCLRVSLSSVDRPLAAS